MAIKRPTKNVQMYIMITVILSSDLCVVYNKSQCHIRAVYTGYVFSLDYRKTSSSSISSDIRQHREHSTCDAALNRRSTAAELGSVELLLRNAIAIVEKANRLLTVSDLAC